MGILDMYKVKKKRAVDPNAPPRPNLLSHEKVLKDTKLSLEQLQIENQQLRRRVDEIESKMIKQTQYLNAVHQALQSRK